jgi:hypothetical protein
VVAGIRFLDKVGKLFPWPHMVNGVGTSIADGLVDASPVPDQRDLGFVPIRVTETSAWNEITAAYQAVPELVANGPSWGCPNADDLTARYYSRLLIQADCANWETAEIAVPPSIPKVQ